MNFLWKKASNEADALFIDIFKDIATQCPEQFKKASKLNSRMKKYKSFPKSDAFSTGYRQKGDKELKEQNWIDAINFYNKSLCFAQNYSNNIYLAFTKRSDCFLHLEMYENCLTDIDLAIGANCPEQLVCDLLKRRQNCLKMMENCSERKEYFPKLSYKANFKYPAMANVLKIKRIVGFGRGIVAKDDIGVGKTIMIEKEFFSLEQPDGPANCSSCLKTMANFIPCNECTDAMFCSYTCMNEKNFHKMCCYLSIKSIIDDEKVAVDSTLFSLNAFPNLDAWMKFVESAVNDKRKKPPKSLLREESKYLAYLKLNNLYTTNDYAAMGKAFVAYITLMSLDSVQEKFNSMRKKRFLMHFVMHAYSVFRSNAYGSQLFINKSYFNHSCTPNIFFVEFGEFTIGISLRPIKKGEQIFSTYTGDASGTYTANRSLFEIFEIKCKCEKCYPNRKVMTSFYLNNNSIYRPVAKKLRKLQRSKPNSSNSSKL